MKAAATVTAVLSYVLLLIVQTAYGQTQFTNLSAVVTPPLGNSPKKVLKAVSGYQVYSCLDGAWTTWTGYATLVDAITNQVAGNFTSLVDGNGTIGTFALFNSKGDSKESGDSASLVRGRAIASSGNETLPEWLLEAESHENFGAASTISYIQMYNAEAGVVSAQEKCTTQSNMTVPFTAEFSLWAQDPLPASVPSQLVAPGRVIDGFFGKGEIVYKHNGSAWVDSGRAGKLYELPGSPVIGEFGETDGVQSWQIFDPNGFLVYAKPRAPTVRVSRTDSPWTSSVVTSTPWSMWSHLGSFTNVQTLSTRGGLPPTTSDQVVVGAETKVEFSAIFWFYTQQFPLETPLTTS